MNNKQLQQLLATYPDDMPIKLLIDHCAEKLPLSDFDEENIMLTSETAYVNEDAHEDEWDCEDGKIELGSGQKFLLINPMIV